MTVTEIADELGVDEATVRRVVAAISKRFRVAFLEIGLTLDDVDPNFFSTVIRDFYSVPRRFSECRDPQIDHAPRAETNEPVFPRRGSSPGQRAGLLVPRRFKRKP